MASTRVYRTLAANSEKKGSISVWFKLGDISSADRVIIGSYYDGTYHSAIKVNSDNRINIFDYRSGFVSNLTPYRMLRDPAAWYHLVFEWDTTQGAAADRNKIYINGVQETSFETETNYSADYIPSWNRDYTLSIGARNSDQYYDGELSNLYFIQGYAYPASTFGSNDATDGMWEINTSPSVNYTGTGTNSSNLKFQDSSNMDLDSGDNTNTFTTAGTLTATKDNPSNNFCTMNPLEKNTNNTQAFSNGNNTAVITAGYAPVGSTMSVSKGKWYVECHIDSTASSGDLNIMLGINGSYNDHGNNTLGYSASAYGYYLYNGYMLNTNTSNSNTGGTQYVTSPGGGIVDDNKYWALALDCDNNKLYVRLDGTWLESADPSAGTGGYGITAPASTDWGYYRFANGVYFGNTNTFKWNFGNGFFGTTSAGATNADSDGYGVFKYSVPTGFKALCTDQLATYG